jgi:type IV secretion system protein TrbL
LRMVRRGQKHFLLWFMLLALASILFTTEAHAANLHDPSGSFTGLLDLVKNSAAAWDSKLRIYATRLFWLLATIQLVWTFFPLVFKQADFGEIVGELIRFIMVIGFFYALLLFSAEWAEAVVNSFRQAGAAAAGLGSTGLKPGDIFGTAVELANTMDNVETWNPLTSFMIAISSLIVLLCFAFIAAFMGLTIIESYVVINASALFMGFGASQWTREYAMALVRYAVSVGAKLFVLTLIVGLIIDSAKDWAAAYNANADDASMWTMVGLSLACAYLAKTIPELIAGMISGTSAGGGSNVGAMAAAAVAGAAAAAATIATAGAAAPAAAGALGGSGGVGGLAGAINSSFAGGSGAATGAGATGGMGTGASVAKMGADSSSLGSGTGGSAAAKSAGAKLGGSNAGSDPSGQAPTSKVSEGVQNAAKQASKAVEGDSDDSSSAQPQSASQGAADDSSSLGTQSAQQGAADDSSSLGTQSAQQGAVDDSSSLGTQSAPQGAMDGSSSLGAPSTAQQQAAEAKKGGGVTGHEVANALTRVGGILSAISVPGMEGAAGLSLGAGAPQPTPEVDSGDNSSMEVQGTEMQNVIRPAEPPAAPKAPGGTADSEADTKGDKP